VNFLPVCVSLALNADVLLALNSTTLKPAPTALHSLAPLLRVLHFQGWGLPERCYIARVAGYHRERKGEGDHRCLAAVDAVDAAAAAAAAAAALLHGVLRTVPPQPAAGKFCNHIVCVYVAQNGV